MDRIDGYGIYGAVADMLFGVGWVVFGASLIAAREQSAKPATPTAAFPIS